MGEYNLIDVLKMIAYCEAQDKVVVNVGPVPYKLKNDNDECIDVWFDNEIDNWVSVWKLPEDKKNK